MKNTNIQDGIILIPDFSGFTEFVFNTKLYTGEYIVRQLLSILIDVNNQYLIFLKLRAMRFCSINTIKNLPTKKFLRCFEI